ncbi:hypothetical protein ABZ686_03960 [Streptomyces sp. NPDC006992]
MGQADSAAAGAGSATADTHMGKYWTRLYAAMTPDSMGTRSWVIGS